MFSLFAKKSLGQNFLKNETIVQEIAEAVTLHPGMSLLEIGPGKGALTKALITRCVAINQKLKPEESALATDVIAVEKDHRLIDVLKETFADALQQKTFTLKEGDILETPLDTIINPSRTYSIAANIPYYITGAFFRRFLAEEEHQPISIVAMIQKEVADRIMARDGKESLLSLSIKVFSKPALIRTVARGNFVPIPNVDSAVIHLSSINNPFKDTEEQRFFFDLIHAGFASKRKMLLGNLKKALPIPESIILNAFTEASLSPQSRAEDVELTQWLKLVHLLRRPQTA